MPSLSAYATLVFDCDGVLLDSNAVKTRAFDDVAQRYGAAAAEAFVDYHIRNGGVSRYQKFSYLFSDILCRDPLPDELEQVLLAYAHRVHEGLLSCSVVEGLESLRQRLHSARWLVASGGDQEELRQVFQARDLARYFDGGIHGSPMPKDRILMDALVSGAIKMPALFIGDSRFDHVCAKKAGLDFVFVSRWSEFPDWQEYCVRESVSSFDDIPALAHAWGSV